MGRALIVTGGRDYHLTDFDRRAFAIFVQKHRIDAVFEGGATGADEGCRKAAFALGLVVHTRPADWAGYGRKAGPIRNSAMVKEAVAAYGIDDVLGLVFPGGVGTADCRRKMLRAGVRVFDVQEVGGA